MGFGKELLLRAAGWGGAWIMRGWLATLRLHVDAADIALDPRGGSSGNIFCSWHEHIVVASYLCRDCNMPVLISRSRDGEYISRIVQSFGFRPIRGSTSRGGAMAALTVLRQEKGSNLAITPDGPRGPRRKVQPGAVFLASRTGMSLVPTGIAYDRARRANSWDRMAFPWPFSRVVMSAARALKVPAEADDEALAEYGRQFEEEMHRMTARAEQVLQQWVETGILPSLQSATGAGDDEAPRKAA